MEVGEVDFYQMGNLDLVQIPPLVMDDMEIWLVVNIVIDILVGLEAVLDLYEGFREEEEDIQVAMDDISINNKNKHIFQNLQVVEVI